MSDSRFRSAALLAASLLGLPLLAQVNTSTIAGVVTDETGAIVPNAKVVATSLETGQQRSSTTNTAGEYVEPQLAPGKYRVTVTAAGFQTAVIDNITLDIAQRAIVNVPLKIGQVSDTLTVTASAPLLDQETASLGQVVTQRTLNDLPLNGRNYITLGSLSPGVMPQLPTGTGSASFIASTTQRSDRSLLIGGQRESSSSYLFDGVEMRNPRIGDSSITPSLDAVQEFKIQRNFFQAEFGNSPGIINVASRGGTNEYHGSLYEFLRNDAMDARNFFSSSPEPFKRNQFGASAGGYIKKDKIFFFGNFENVRQRLGSIQRGTYPTQTLLSGNFSAQATPINDPLTYDASTNTRTPFPGNIIPANRINSVSKNFFPYIPVTNVPGANNVTGTPVQTLDDDQLNFRGDWIINSKNSMFGRYSRQNAPLEPASLVPLGGSLVTSKGISVVAQLTSSLTPAIVNVARAAYSYMNLFGKQVAVDQNIAQQIGITGISTAPINWGVPGVAWQGYSSIGSNGLTQGNILNNYKLADNLTWIRGGHTIKTGYDLEQSRLFLDSDNGPRGSFTFNSSFTASLDPVTGNPISGTGSGVADFLLGYPTNMSGAVGTSATHFQFYTQSLFLQDDWKITREFTLNYGLRWEYEGPPTPIQQEYNHVYGFDFNTGKQLFPTLNQIRPSIIKPDYKDFAPRLGFAYNPSWASSLVLRGGIGIYYDQTQLNETQFITNGPPIFTQQNINLTGRGLPQYQFGVNTLPVVTIPPVDSNYITPAGTNLFVEEIDGRKPRVYMWTYSMQKSFWKSWLLEAAYVGSHGRRLSKRYNAYSNVTPGVLYDVTPGVATRYPQLNQMLYSSQAGWSDFNALNLKLERRFSNGFQLLMAETWAKSIDTDSAGSYGSPNLNPANFQLDKGPSDFDIRHRWVTSIVYELPFGKSKRWLNKVGRAGDLIVGGWQANMIASWQTGNERSVSAPNLTGISYVTQRADATGVDLSSSFNGIDPGQDFDGANSSRYWFNPAAFSPTLPLKFGTSGRDIITAPSIWNFDLSAFKNFVIKENMYLQFRVESFNALNDVKFFPPDMSVTSPTFATLQSADRPRVMQLALRFNF